MHVDIVTWELFSITWHYLRSLPVRIWTTRVPDVVRMNFTSGLFSTKTLVYIIIKIIINNH